MLYREEWSTPKAKPSIQPDVFSLEGLIGWLEGMPADTSYDYCDPYNCLLCQYFRAAGMAVDSVSFNVMWRDKHSRGIQFPDIMREISIGEDRQEAWTFGAALERARKARAALSADGSGV